ncbi:thioredoxin family protein [Sporosarcina sp. E16_3]|uniref:thioredoxin family protein n=1 Tax=Sporosarcina sp. E16_3 TaxID=2789293 RepID=UPI001A911B26|nr:thioredoxin family protein [Sporosarcina sp. E16_3]MBO0602733.1 thioredoxin family protein [Sporosarcina sp. E16_3]
MTNMRKLTLIKRSIPRCPACTMMQQALEREGVPHVTIDITEDMDAIAQYGISSIPVMIIEDADGTEIERLAGFHPAEAVAELLKGER